MPAGTEVIARRVLLRGRVQGLGFRPAVCRLARARGLAGWVRNTGGVVEILVEGPAAAVHGFEAALAAGAPPGARITGAEVTDVPAEGRRGFRVEPAAGGRRGWVPPDVATCDACLAELADPRNRRHRYPFITCATCGPRFTIVRRLPWDRAGTTMGVFEMCATCRAEHDDPDDRRFCAETVSCPRCGPRLSVTGPAGEPRPGDPLALAADTLRAGGIVAVKALGGYHLATCATDPAALGRLRARKRRARKPFAVMVADLDAAARLADLDPCRRAWLGAPEAPIVLAPARDRLPPEVTGGLAEVGLMLPATPVHHLLAAAVPFPLVMTSGNRSGEPICVTEADALARLGGIADLFLTHDREIAARCDDSVLRAGPGGLTVMVRRSRGWAGTPVPLGRDLRPALGVGAHLHTTLCLAAGREAFLSAHVGDLDTAEAIDAWHDAHARLEATTGIRAEVIACDRHPDLPSTRIAEDLARARSLPLVRVQHHHAHVAAVMAEHQRHEPVLGVAFDGLGWGDDGTVWGGELLVADLTAARRLGRLRPVRQPGGDAAVRRPVRMALAHALDAGCGEAAVALLAGVLAPGEAARVAALVRSGVGSSPASSAGRLFDAVSALCGLAADADYDGEPAIRLEQACADRDPAPYPFGVQRRAGAAVADPAMEIDTRPLISGVIADRAAGVAAGEVAARFHASVVEIIVALARAGRELTGIDVVCCAGGTFTNLRLLGRVIPRLEAEGFAVLRAETVPAGDGGLALGQAVVAATRVERHHLGPGGS